MRVVVDRVRCEGNAICVGLAPGVFELGDDAVVVVKSERSSADDEQLLGQAIADCPRAALSRQD